MAEQRSPFWRAIEGGTMSDEEVLNHLNSDLEAIRQQGGLLGTNTYKAVKKEAIGRSLVDPDEVEVFELVYWTNKD